MPYQKLFRTMRHAWDQASSLRNNAASFFKEYGLFVVYRWLTWIFAMVFIIVSPSLHTSDSFVLLFVSGLVTIVLTLLAKQYVRIAQHFPAILGLDILFGCILLWASNGTVLPFLPFALGSLVLPVLLSGWRISLFAALVFIALDNGGLALMEVANNDSLSYIIGHWVVPPLFVIVLDNLFHLFQYKPSYAMALQESFTDDHFTDAHKETKKPEPTIREPFPWIYDTSDSFSDHPSPAPPLHPTEASHTHVAWRLMPTEASIADGQGNYEFRRVMYDLTPDTNVALHVALQRLVTDFSQRSGIPVCMVHDGGIRTINEVPYMTLFRLAQEALLNIQQHSHARSGIVTLTYGKDTLTMTILDDGVGLLHGNYERGGVHALRAMYYRFAEIDGLLEVFEQEKGVTVRATIPL